MTKEKLLKIAEEEFCNILVNATEVEIDNLLRDLDIISGGSPVHCIYGLMTGNCWSDRSTQLIQNCTRGVYFRRIVSSEERQTSFLYRRVDFKTSTYSPLERALFLYPSEIKAMIASYLLPENITV